MEKSQERRSFGRAKHTEEDNIQMVVKQTVFKMVDRLL
jgi:hypothetical protein